MKNNITSLPTKGSATFEQILNKVMETIDDEQKNLKIFSGVMILETDQGVAYFNLQRDTLMHLIGLLEVGKVALIDQLASEEQY